MEWLEATLNKATLPTFIFTHCAIDDHDTSGNFFYEAYDGKKKSGSFFENQKAIREIIFKSHCVVGVFQGHLHYFHANTDNGIPYITCSAMGDNICGPSVDVNIPEIYTILDVKKSHFVIKAYSREYCFAGSESMITSMNLFH